MAMGMRADFDAAACKRAHLVPVQKFLRREPCQQRRKFGRGKGCNHGIDRFLGADHVERAQLPDDGLGELLAPRPQNDRRGEVGNPVRPVGRTKEKQQRQENRIALARIDMMRADEQRPWQAETVQNIRGNVERVGIAVVGHQKDRPLVAIGIFQRLVDEAERQHIEVRLQRLGDLHERIQFVMVGLDSRIQRLALDAMEEYCRGAAKRAHDVCRDEPAEPARELSKPAHGAMMAPEALHRS